MDVPYSRTMVKQKSLSNTMIRAYNWLMDFDLIPESLEALTKNEINVYLTDILSVYILNNKDLMAMFFVIL